jgi:hypothetical protein
MAFQNLKSKFIAILFLVFSLKAFAQEVPLEFFAAQIKEFPQIGRLTMNGKEFNSHFQGKYFVKNFKIEKDSCEKDTLNFTSLDFVYGLSNSGYYGRIVIIPDDATVFINSDDDPFYGDDFEANELILGEKVDLNKLVGLVREKHFTHSFYSTAEQDSLVFNGSKILLADSDTAEKVAALNELHRKYLQILLSHPANIHRTPSQRLAAVMIELTNWKQVKSIVWLHFENQIGDKVGSKILTQVAEGIWYESSTGDRKEVIKQIYRQLEEQLSTLAGVQLDQQFQVKWQGWGQVRYKGGDEIWSKVWDLVWAQVASQVRHQIGEQLAGEINAALAHIDIKKETEEKTLGKTLTPIIHFAYMVFQITNLVNHHSPQYKLMHRQFAQFIASKLKDKEILEILEGLSLPASGDDQFLNAHLGLIKQNLN